MGRGMVRWAERAERRVGGCGGLVVAIGRGDSSGLGVDADEEAVILEVACDEEVRESSGVSSAGMVAGDEFDFHNVL